MKLLFVLPEFGASVRGGIATFYNDLLPGLIRAGCTIDVCLASERQLPSDLRRQSAVRVFGIDPALVEQGEASLPQFSAFPDLRHALACAFAAFSSCRGGREYDVVETTDWGLLYVPWVINDTGPPIVVQLHGSNGQTDFYEPREGSGLAGLITRLIETSLLGRADELQSYGPANAGEWSRLLNSDVFHIWPVGHQGGEYSTELQPELNAESNGVVVGRIQSWKGPEVLCQAMKLLGEQAPKILWVGGDTESRRHKKSMSAFLKATYGKIWGEAILPVGEMPREITRRIQATAKFVVVPSRWDTFNIAAVEAMSASRVVICSEGAGASSLIRHGENGFRFASDDSRRLADLLLEVDRLTLEERTKIGQRAHETVARELDIDRVCALRIDRYRHLKESKIVRRCQHRWLPSLFASETPEPPFAFLSTIPAKHLAVAIFGKRIVRGVLLRTWHGIRNAIG